METNETLIELLKDIIALNEALDMASRNLLNATHRINDLIGELNRQNIQELAQVTQGE